MYFGICFKLYRNYYSFINRLIFLEKLKTTILSSVLDSCWPKDLQKMISEESELKGYNYVD